MCQVMLEVYPPQKTTLETLCKTLKSNEKQGSGINILYHGTSIDPSLAICAVRIHHRARRKLAFQRPSRLDPLRHTKEFSRYRNSVNFFRRVGPTAEIRKVANELVCLALDPWSRSGRCWLAC